MAKPTSQDKILVVTDSTASLPLTNGVRQGLEVVNLHVIHEGSSYEENVDVTHDQCVRWITSHEPISTSQPTKQAFLTAFESARADGYTHVVCALISSKLSGTYDTAVAASREASIPVEVIDSLTSGMALGLSVIAGAEVASTPGVCAADVSQTIRDKCANAQAYFMVDSLDHLRRGGRLSAPAAALGSVLGMKPILQLGSDGSIGVAAKVRSRAGALDYLCEVARTHALENKGAAFGIHYFGDDGRAHQLASRIEQSTHSPVEVSPLSTVLGAHVGPGSIALTWA